MKKRSVTIYLTDQELFDLSEALRVYVKTTGAGLGKGAFLAVLVKEFLKGNKK